MSADTATAAGSVLRWYHWAIVGAIDVLGPFSTDSYIPNLSAMRQSLATTPVMAGLTLQLNWLSKGLATLAIGAISDRAGRRAALMRAFVFYIVGTTGCAMTPSSGSYRIWTLLLFRVIQGIGESGTTVCTAVARDVLHDPQHRLHVLTVITSLRITAVAISPTVGGVLGSHYGWRAVFWGLAGCGVLLFAATACFLPETLHYRERPKQTRFGYRAVAASLLTRAECRHALGALLSNAINFAGLLSYLSNVSPLLEDHFHMSTFTTALLMGSVASIFVVVNTLLAVALRIFTTPIDPINLLKTSSAVAIMSAVMALYFGLVSNDSVMCIMVTCYVFALGSALGFGAANTVFIQPFADAAGKAAALLLIVRTLVSTAAAQVSVDVTDSRGLTGFYFFFAGAQIFVFPALFFLVRKPNVPLTSERLLGEDEAVEEIDDSVGTRTASEP